LNTCARCGLPKGEWTEAEKCSAHQPDNDGGVIDCRNRELASLRALLRANTLRLERIAEQLNEALESIS
jgi:hypothetical protein